MEFGAFSEDGGHRAPTLAVLDAAAAMNVSVDSTSMYQLFERAWALPALRDPAPAWIAAQKDQGVRDAAWKQLALEFARTDPARAREILPLIADPKAATNVSSTIAAEMARTTPLEAMQFASTLGDEARGKAQASAIVTWARLKPAESLAFVREHPEQLGKEYFSPAAREWVKQDAPATLDLVDAVLPEPERNGVLRDVATTWMQSRPDQVEAWLATAADGRVKDAVVQAKAGPPRTNRLAGVTWSGQGDEIETMHGSSGESSTSAKINGRTVRYFY